MIGIHIIPTEGPTMGGFGRGIRKGGVGSCSRGSTGLDLINSSR